MSALSVALSSKHEPEPDSLRSTTLPQRSAHPRGLQQLPSTTVHIPQTTVDTVVGEPILSSSPRSLHQRRRSSFKEPGKPLISSQSPYSSANSSPYLASQYLSPINSNMRLSSSPAPYASPSLSNSFGGSLGSHGPASPRLVAAGNGRKSSPQIPPVAYGSFQSSSLSSVPSLSIANTGGSANVHANSQPRRSSAIAVEAATANTINNSNDALSTSPLNTNSPVALAAAAAVTTDKLANLLLTQGPLPIRHITTHLTLTIQGFGDLSLSKQRRLIIAVLENPDPALEVVFEKVGWGRWQCRKTGDASTAEPGNTPRKPKDLADLGKFENRRDSITAHLNNGKPPSSPLLKPFKSSGLAVDDSIDDDVFFDSSDEDEEEDDVDVDDDDDDDDLAVSGVFEVDDDDPDLKSMKRKPSAAYQDENKLDSKHGDTDEEDWKSMGPRAALSQRRQSQKEKDAIAALVQLQSL